MKNPFFVLAGIGVFFLLVVLLMQDFLLCAFFEKKINQLTGFKTKIEHFHYQYPGAFHIQGLKLYNPPGSENPFFVECSHVYIILNMPEFVRRERLKIYVMDISVREMHIEKNKNGVSNIRLLKPFMVGIHPKGEKPASLPFELDQINLTLRNVDFLDRSGEAYRKVSSRLKLEREEYGPFSDPNGILALIASKIINETEFGSEIGLESSLFEEAVN